MKVLISESEKSDILSMYGRVTEDSTPLQRLMSCKISQDGKYLVFEGKAYNSQTGEEVPLNEEWTLSDILHTGADVLSAGADFVLPGSGAIVDTLNAISYIVEAQFKSPEEKDSLYLMAAVTFAFVILPGPLQAVAVPLKRFLKGGVKVATPAVKQALGVVGGILGSVLPKISEFSNKALNSKLGQSIVGKWGKKISGAVSDFYTRVKSIFGKISKEAPVPKKSAGELGQQVGKVMVNNAIVDLGKKFFSKIPKISNGPFLLKKLGFIPGKSYRYIGNKGATTAVVSKVTDNGVLVTFKKGNQMMVPMETFVKNAIGAPWGRRGYTVAVPLFIKRFTDFITTDGGNIDYVKLQKFADLDPTQTSQESLSFLQEETASYEGDKGTYSVNKNVQAFQNGLNLLGYKLSKYGIDGKFGPETKKMLEKFQNENGLTSSVGKMDRLTARKIAELLKSKNIPKSEEIQKTLNSI